MNQNKVLEAFYKTYQTVLQDIITDKEAPKSKEIQEWVKQVIDYNVPHGKMSRGLDVVNTFKLMNKNNDIKEEDIELARILGWIVELFQAYFLVYDDIIDQSITIRGQPCWYRKNSFNVNYIGLYMSSCDSAEEHKVAEEILLKIGELFQIQDDIHDCFGDPEVIGKIGTDIEEGKCSWLAFMALKLANESDHKVLKDNIGIKNIESVKKVKDIYAKLGLKQIFEELEETTYKEICKSIEDLKAQKSKLEPQIFLGFLNKIYKRKF